MGRIILVSFISLLLIVLVVGCAGQATQPPESNSGDGKNQVSESKGESAQVTPLAEIYEAAKEEGEVNFTSAIESEIMQKLFQRFNEVYPGIKVNYINMTAGQSMERIVTESNSGKISIDMTQTALSLIDPLLSRDLLAQEDWSKVAGINPEQLFLDNRFVHWYELPVTIAYNSQLISDIEAPKTWEDMVSEEWNNGKIILDVRGTFMSHLPFIWDQEQTMEYAHKLKELKPIFVPRASASSERLAAGEAPIGVVAVSNLIKLKEMGAPVEWTGINPVPVSVMGISVVRDAEHPNAARLLTAWLSTDEAREMLNKEGYPSSSLEALKSVALEGQTIEVWVEDSIEKATERTNLQKEIQSIFESK